MGGHEMVVVASFENAEGNRCVDLFARPDGTWGFEEYRKDPEDSGAWTRVGYYAYGRYATREEAVTAATAQVVWLSDALGTRGVERGRGSH
ncbi:MAG: hypothetical protein ACHQF3_06145, partial [Alphaproteobacteria bacterium]